MPLPGLPGVSHAPGSLHHSSLGACATLAGLTLSSFVALGSGSGPRCLGMVEGGRLADCVVWDLTKICDADKVLRTEFVS